MENRGNRFKLRSCVWEITLACCFSCRYCGSKAGTARRNELTMQECFGIAEQLAQLGCRRVSLIGGEVFMRPDWKEITRALTDRGISVSVITNGFLFTPELISALKQVNIESVAASLDGPEPVHDRYRQPGSFARAIRAIDVLAENEIPVSVISTLHSGNYRCLEELYEVLKDRKLFAWQLQACSPMGNAKSGDFSTQIDFQDVMAFVLKHLKTSRFIIGVADNIGYFTEYDGMIRGDSSGNHPFPGCRAGLSSIGIDSVGNVRGCESMYAPEFIEGNLREKSLAEIWNDPDAFSYNRKFRPDLLSGKCASCKFGSICAGGCRSYNFFTCGKIYESRNCARIFSPGAK